MVWWFIFPKIDSVSSKESCHQSAASVTSVSKMKPGCHRAIKLSWPPSPQSLKVERAEATAQATSDTTKHSIWRRRHVTTTCWTAEQLRKPLPFPHTDQKFSGITLNWLSVTLLGLKQMICQHRICSFAVFSVSCASCWTDSNTASSTFQEKC